MIQSSIVEGGSITSCLGGSSKLVFERRRTRLPRACASPLVASVRRNKRLANFVRVAATCIDAAKMMQQSVEHRDDAQIEPPRNQTDLDALAAEIEHQHGWQHR